MKIERWKGPGTPDERTLREALERDGYSVYPWTDGRGATYEPHTHGDVLRPGDRDWLPAGTVHSARVVEGPVTYLIGSRRASS